MIGDRAAAAWLVLLGVGWSACFHHTRDWNSASRLLLTHAIVQTNSVEVTPFVAANGLPARDPPTKDLSSPDGLRYFSDKAPGQSLLGAAAFFPMRALRLADDHPFASDPFGSRPERLSLRRTDYLLTVATSGLASGLTLAVVFLLLRRWGVGTRSALAAALALEFASPWQAYSTLYYGHVLAGFFALLALWFFDARLDARPVRSAAMFLAGICAGAAVMVEYTLATLVLAAVSAAGLAGFQHGLLRRQHHTGSFVSACAFLLGGCIPALVLGWYHWRVTGDPFVPAYRFEVERDFAAVHATKSGIPLSSLQPNALKELLFGPSVGLLWFAPAAAWGVAGAVGLIRARPNVGWTVLLSFVLLTLAMACFPNWNGGLATGPRFLVPALPLLFVSAGWLWGRASASVVGRWLLILSTLVIVAAALLNTAMNAAGARKPFDMLIDEFLHRSFAAPARETHLGDWLLARIGIHPTASTALLLLLAVETLAVLLLLRGARPR